MNKSVFVMLTDDAWVEKTQALWQNAIHQGQWTGDFAVIGVNLSQESKDWYEANGFYVYEINRPIHSKLQLLLVKCELFNDYFKQWEQVVFYDTDVVILQPITELAEVKMFGACAGSCGGDKLKWRWRFHFLPEYKDLWKEYDMDNHPGLNGGLYAFNTRFCESSYETLKDYQDKYRNILFWEEGIIGLAHYNRTEWLDPSWCYPIMCSRYPTRDNHKAYHYLGYWMYKPWTEGKYFNALWKENLAKAVNK